MVSTGNLKGDVIAGSVTVGVASFIGVLLRIKARRLRRVPLATVDYSMIAAMVLSWGIVIGNVTATQYGLGHHLQTLSMIELMTFLKVFLASQILWAIAIPVVKFSILMQYLRIFGVMAYMRICAWSLMAVSLMWGIMVVVVLLAKCQPLAYNWDKSLNGRCANEMLFYKIGTAINVVGDFLILILPMPAIWSLNVRLSKKLQVATVFVIASMQVFF
ncbi:hypothetical protein E8E12_004343 [Didymella heteroderae]|uniref:Rhodopsin domain-containing protein n=1 Tax=Didymella heteroderae TaxID=1769908 RepID=A0A9P4WHS6_9PLEO|nr:hypothetical protein E8E12_004343 [Didymella heteroderae]